MVSEVATSASPSPGAGRRDALMDAAVQPCSARGDAPELLIVGRVARDQSVLVGEQHDAVVLADDADTFGARLVGRDVSGGGVERDAWAGLAHEAFGRCGEDKPGALVGAGHLDRTPDPFPGRQVVGGGSRRGQGVGRGLEVAQDREGSAVRVGGHDEPGAARWTLRGPQHVPVDVHGGELQHTVAFTGGQIHPVRVLRSDVPPGVHDLQLLERRRQPHARGVHHG